MRISDEINGLMVNLSRYDWIIIIIYYFVLYMIT